MHIGCVGRKLQPEGTISGGVLRVCCSWLWVVASSEVAFNTPDTFVRDDAASGRDIKQEHLISV